MEDRRLSYRSDYLLVDVTSRSSFCRSVVRRAAAVTTKDRIPDGAEAKCNFVSCHIAIDILSTKQARP